jgi:hypothetical protein
LGDYPAAGGIIESRTYGLHLIQSTFLPLPFPLR